MLSAAKVISCNFLHPKSEPRLTEARDWAMSYIA
jgi:hypothetical protein